MCGGVSHLDTFDPKPALEKYHGQPLPGERDVQVQQGFPGPIMRSPYKFKKYGQVGDRGLGAVSAHRDDGGRYRVDSLRGGSFQRSLHLALRVEHGRGSAGISELRRVGDLRAGHREPESAGVRGASSITAAGRTTDRITGAPVICRRRTRARRSVRSAIRFSICVLRRSTSVRRSSARGWIFWPG